MLARRGHEAVSPGRPSGATLRLPPSRSFQAASCSGRRAELFFVGALSVAVRAPDDAAVAPDLSLEPLDAADLLDPQRLPVYVVDVETAPVSFRTVRAPSPALPPAEEGHAVGVEPALGRG